MMFTDLPQPQELESEILVRVPATCLTQLRSTCKRWYALFKDPRFIEKNMDKAARHFILKKDDGIYSVSIDLHNTSIEFTGKLTTLKDLEQVVISKIYQCDGLLLCTTKNENRLVVWNPCTGQTRWIQPSNRNPNYVHGRYVLGYEKNDKSCYSYKILWCNEYLDQFEIYDFNSDSWRLLDKATHIWFIISRGVSLKGNIYWVACDKKQPFTTKYVLRFDFKRETFERLSLPSECNYFNGENLCLSVVREEKLAVFLQRIHTDPSMKIWVMDTKIDEAKDTNIQYFLVVDHNEIWRTLMNLESFLVDEENKKVVCCGRHKKDPNRIIVYVVGEDHYIHVCEQVHGEIAQGQYHYYWQLSRRAEDYLFRRPYYYEDVFISYVPSLVQI